VTAAVRCLLALAAGLSIGLVFGAAWGYITRDREARTEHADIVRKANAALDAIALEMALAYEPQDFELWAKELRDR
jgi:hypothetical protein